MRFLLALLLLASPLQSQTIVLVSATDSVKRFLAAHWDDQRNAGQNEAAWCASYVFAVGQGGEPFIILTGIDSADTKRASPRGISFDCPTQLVEIHSHPPSSEGEGGFYSFGGIGAHICGPSQNDLNHLAKSGRLFAVVRCDRYALVGFSTKVIWPKP